MAENKKFNWIRDEIEIPFRLPIYLKNLCNDAEKLDLEHNELYFNYAEMIDLDCKALFTEKKITQQQWDQMVRRYPY